MILSSNDLLGFFIPENNNPINEVHIFLHLAQNSNFQTLYKHKKNTVKIIPNLIELYDKIVEKKEKNTEIIKAGEELINAIKL